MSKISLLPLLRKLLDLQVDQEAKDDENPEQSGDRLRTPWEVAVPILLNEFQVEGITVQAIREHLVRLRADGIHWPLFAGKTGDEFHAQHRATPLGGVERSTPVSSELARLDRDGFGNKLIEKLRLNYPEETAKLNHELDVDDPAPKQENLMSNNGASLVHPGLITMRCLRFVKALTDFYFSVRLSRPFEQTREAIGRLLAELETYPSELSNSGTKDIWTRARARLPGLDLAPWGGQVSSAHYGVNKVGFLCVRLFMQGDPGSLTVLEQVVSNGNVLYEPGEFTAANFNWDALKQGYEQTVQRFKDSPELPINQLQVELEKELAELRLDRGASLPAVEQNQPPAASGVKQPSATGSAEEQLPDGPFDGDGFRHQGREVRFRRAAKQRALILALWDEKKSCPPREQTNRRCNQ